MSSFYGYSLRSKMVVHCCVCGTELDSTDPLPAPDRCFVKCYCEAGAIPHFVGGETGGEWLADKCDFCDGWGEFVYCSSCYERYFCD